MGRDNPLRVSDDDCRGTGPAAKPAAACCGADAPACASLTGEGRFGELTDCVGCATEAASPRSRRRIERGRRSHARQVPGRRRRPRGRPDLGPLRGRRHLSHIRRDVAEGADREGPARRPELASRIQRGLRRRVRGRPRSCQAGRDGRAGGRRRAKPSDDAERTNGSEHLRSEPEGAPDRHPGPRGRRHRALPRDPPDNQGGRAEHVERLHRTGKHVADPPFQLRGLRPEGAAAAQHRSQGRSGRNGQLLEIRGGGSHPLPLGGAQRAAHVRRAEHAAGLHLRPAPPRQHDRRLARDIPLVLATLPPPLAADRRDEGNGHRPHPGHRGPDGLSRGQAPEEDRGALQVRLAEDPLPGVDGRDGGARL